MSEGLFENGNRRIMRMAVLKLAFGCLALSLTQIQGFLPALDFLTPKQLKITSFSLMVFLTLIRSGEMFWDKTVSLFKTGKTGDTEPPFKQP